jgi:xanthine dehydrogenase small subunit
LTGRGWNEAGIEHAMKALAADYTPLSDWRASADYRLLVAKNLLRRFYLETSSAEQVRLDRTAKMAV